MEMRNRQYFEGTLQLRNCREEIIDFVRKKADEEGAWIAKEVKQKEGIDLYLSSNKFLKKIARLLKERFKGITKESSKLFTEDFHSGKKVYRGTILFKMPNFKVGDIGTYNGDEIKIISVGKKVNVQNTKTGKKSIHKFDDINKGFRPISE
jgi:nonsense-mediated mRNA decay protein 3